LIELIVFSGFVNLQKGKVLPKIKFRPAASDKCLFSKGIGHAGEKSGF
jgi:hypothetical protein